MLKNPPSKTDQGISNGDIVRSRLHTHHICHTILERQLTCSKHTVHVEVDLFFLRIITYNEGRLIETGIGIVQNMEMSLTSIQVAP
jgi:hypothetical protein